LRFFADRFTTEELARLYGDYRGPRYFEVRHRHEPWYTARFNCAIAHHGATAAARRAGLTTFLADSGAPGPFDSILDYGGDAGQLIPQELTTNPFVFDISGSAPVAGVRRIMRHEDLQPNGYSLVLLSHVLEHVPEPLELLRELRALTRNSDGLVYLEVPIERPWMGIIGRGSITRSYLRSLGATSLLLRGVDFYSSVFRLKVGIVPPLGFPKLSEHINFFSVTSLGQAFDRSGFELLKVGESSTLGQGRTVDSIACLARASGDHGSARAH
jgi:hypothetical protein